MGQAGRELQSGFILQHKNYKESSLILDVLTSDNGIIPILAKGVRNKHSRWAGVLLPFSRLDLCWSGKGDLKTLVHVEFSEKYQLQGMALYCGFYVNELTSCFLHPYDPHPETFRLYQHCLEQLQHNQQIERILRAFELKLMELSGYGLQLDCDGRGFPIKPDNKYYYQVNQGLICDEQGNLSGKMLLALQQQKSLSEKYQAEAKQLLRLVIDHHLQGKKLKSRSVLANIIRYL